MSCLYRFKREHLEYGKGIQGEAAKFGIAIHDTLEYFVKAAWLRDRVDRTLEALLQIWQLKFTQHYGGLGEDPAEYKLGVEILTRWFERGDLFQPGRKVLTVEVKENFTLTVDGHDIQCNYIIDRLDEKEDGTIVVVDYKTSVWALDLEDLRNNVQTRLYALACQIKYPAVPGVWVEFDYLKHENQPIGVYLSKQDNAATFLAMKAELRKILQAPDDPKPTLNDSCLFCPVKVTCPAVKKNISVGGVMSLTTTEMADTRTELEHQIAAANSAIKELDALLMSHAKENDLLAIEGTKSDLIITMSKRRYPESERIAKLLGPDRWARHGSETISVGEVDKLLKSSELTDDEKAELRTYAPVRYGDPKFKSKAKTSFDSL
jgi:RecB family exonuclease